MMAEVVSFSGTQAGEVIAHLVEHAERISGIVAIYTVRHDDGSESSYSARSNLEPSQMSFMLHVLQMEFLRQLEESRKKNE